jgi:hypothetical protein
MLPVSYLLRSGQSFKRKVDHPYPKRMPPRETNIPITMAGIAEPGTPAGWRNGILSRMEVHCILFHMA